MKRQITLVTAAILALFLVFFLVMMKFKSPESTLVPPNQVGQNAEIEKAFISSLKKHNGDNGSSYSLQYPSTGKYRTAYIKYDIDGDGHDEVIVFYTLSSAETTVRINILEKVHGKWKSILDESGYGGKIDSVDFVDLNNDGKKELVFTWSLYDSDAYKILTVQTLQKMEKKGEPYAELITRMNQPFSFMGIKDMDGDGNENIIVVYPDKSLKVRKSYLNIYRMKEDYSIRPISTPVPLDGTVSGYADIHYEKQGGTTVALLDAVKGEDAMITEVFWWDRDKKQIITPFLDTASLKNMATYRPALVPVLDVNSDGMYEIPIMDTEDSKNTGGESRVGLTTWCSIDINEPGQLIPSRYAFVNTAGRYSFNIEPGYKGKVSAYIQNDTGVMTVYSSPDGTEKGDPLFSIVKKQKTQLAKDDTHTFIRETGDYAVFGTLTSAGEKAGFTNRQIEKDLIFY